MGTKNFGTRWVLRRELEIRARRPAWYQGFRYEGFSQPLVWLVLPVGVALVLWWLVPWHRSKHALGAVIPYTLYLAYQAAVLTAGSLAVDRTRLGRLPVSATSFLAGKLVGSLLPLWGEIVVSAPLVVCLWDVVAHNAATGAWVVAYLLALVLGWGAWGALWASGGPSARAALTATKVSLALALVGLPLLAWFLASGVPGEPPVVVLQPVLMLHPAGGLLLVGDVVDHTTQARWGLYAATAVPGLALLLAWLGLKRRLR